MQTAKLMPPKAEEIELARIFLREELAKSENQPEETMLDADVVFKDARERLNAKF